MTAPATPNDAGNTEGTAPATGEEALGDPGKAALAAIRREKADAEKRARDLAAELQAIKDKDASASELATRKATEAETRAQSAEHKLAQITAAIEAKLDLSLAPRLQGSTPEELLADAKALAKQFTPAAPPAVVPGGKPQENLKPTGGADPTPPIALNDDPLLKAIVAKVGKAR